MGKLNLVNLSEELMNKFGGVNLPSNEIFMDAVNGNDDNDGFIESAPIKTLTKLSDTLSYKSSKGVVNVNFKPGTYLGVLEVNFFQSSSLKLNGGDNIILSPTVSENTSGISFIMSNTKVRMNKIIVRPLIGTYSHPNALFAIYNSHVSSVVYDDVTIDLINYTEPHAYAIVHDYVECIAANLRFINNNAHTPFQGGIGSYTAFNDLYSDAPTYITFLTGGMGQINSTNIESENIGIETGFENYAGNYRGLDLKQINDGSILESGSNSNGRYVKYANGDLYCSMHTEITILAGELTQIKDITFPYPFIDRPNVLTGNTGTHTVLNFATINSGVSIEGSDRCTLVIKVDEIYTAEDVPVTLAVWAFGRWY